MFSELWSQEAEPQKADAAEAEAQENNVGLYILVFSQVRSGQRQVGSHSLGAIMSVDGVCFCRN